MNWDTIFEFSTKVWVLIFVPIIGWLEKKRREFSSLSQKVESLESEVKHINEKIDEDRSEREARRVEDQRYRERTSETLDKIYDTLQDVRKDTAVNSAKLEERK